MNFRPGIDIFSGEGLGGVSPRVLGGTLSSCVTHTRAGLAVEGKSRHGFETNKRA